MNWEIFQHWIKMKKTYYSKGDEGEGEEAGYNKSGVLAKFAKVLSWIAWVCMESLNIKIVEVLLLFKQLDIETSTCNMQHHTKINSKKISI